MGVFEMVAIIVTVSVMGGIITEWLKTKKGMGGEATKRLERQEAELDALKKRIRNLETIVALEPSARLSLPESDPEDYASPSSGLKNKLKTR